VIAPNPALGGGLSGLFSGLVSEKRARKLFAQGQLDSLPFSTALRDFFINPVQGTAALQIFDLTTATLAALPQPPRSPWWAKWT
jgi:hypothetical protein